MLDYRPNGEYVPEDRNTHFRYVWSCQNEHCQHIAGKPYVMESCYCRLSRHRAGRMVCVSTSIARTILFFFIILCRGVPLTSVTSAAAIIICDSDL